MPDKKIDANLMIHRVMGQCWQSPKDIILPNFYFGRWECDVFRIDKNGKIYEYEIKISNQDIRNDSKKNNQGVKTQTKYENILEGSRCNYFYYVVPEKLVSSINIPKWAGILIAHPYYKLIRLAKCLNKKNIVIDYKELCHRLATREKNLRIKHTKW